MANSIKIKRSAVPSKVPMTTDLALGELAINTYDGKLYLKMDDGSESIVTVNAGGGGSGDVSGPGSSTDNAITRFNGTTGKLIQNSTATLDDSGVISVSGANISGLTASSAVATDGSKNLVSVANTGTGDNVLGTSPSLSNPALGTPSALVGTNITGTASGLSIGGNAATVTTNANLTGVITSSGNATSIASQTGTGTKFVVDTSPILITPNLGTPSAGLLTNCTGTATALNIGGTAALATNIAGGAAGNVPFQSATNATGFVAAGTAGQVLTSTGAYAPQWSDPATTGVTSVTGTSPIASSGGATPDISISQATTSTSGYLSSTDWNTFNGKGTGSVTSVSGTGTVSGISLSGTVTTTGSLALGGSLDLSSPPTIGNTAANTGAFTTLSASGHTTFEGVTSTGATGTGKLVYDTSPTLVTPALGTPTALVATNASGTAASLTAGAATVLATARNIAGVSFDGSADINIPLANLSDVTLSSPVVNQLLSYNGTSWINSNAASAGAGSGVVFYNASPVISPSGIENLVQIDTLATIPVVTTELTVTGSANNSMGAVLFSAFVSAPLGRTVIDAGVWDFTTWIGVDSANLSNTVTRQVYTAIPFVNSYTVTMSGTGTTRTATASGGTPFATSAIVASSVSTDASYLQTPSGIYQIITRVSDTVVTINHLPSTYTNESAVVGTVWKALFGVTTGDINDITPNYGLFTNTVTAGSYAITTATKVGILGFFTSTTNSTLHTVTITYNGTLRNTHVSTPLVNLHNSLAGLNGGAADEYYHSTAAEYTGTGTGVFVRETSPTLVTPALGTPTALVGTNITGTASGLTAGHVTTNANLTGMVTSVGNATTVVTNANLTGGVTSVGNAATVITNANLTGEVTSTGNATTVTNAAVIAKVLTGYVSGEGTVAATDSILQAMQKLNGNILAVPGTVTSVAALTLGTAGTDLSSIVATGTTTPIITLNVPTASASNRGALSSTDWTTFNGKGTVTNVGFTGGLITVANGTTTPAFTVAGTSGGIPYFNASSTWTSSGVLAVNSIMLGGGAGATPFTTTTGTGVVTALGINPGTAGSFVVNGGALGTPSAGVLTNATGTATGLTAGTATTANGVAAGVVAGKTIYDSFTATALQTTFTTSATYISGKIQVYANGVKMVNAADVTVTSGTSVVFAVGVKVGTLVDLVYPT